VSNQIPEYRVGFDRFIALEWTKSALEIALLPDKLVSQRERIMMNEDWGE
jgi:hypothetical protein